MQYLFNELELPMEALQTLNLSKQGRVTIDNDNLEAMFAGRRSSLIEINDIQLENVRIARLEAKLSLHRDETGEVELLIHPIYRNPQGHHLLDSEVQMQLVEGEKDNHVVEVETGEDRTQTMVIEYDKDTREFLNYDAANVHAPSHINGEELDQGQQQAYRRGEPVSIYDDTTVQYRASEPKGILANTEKVILTFKEDNSDEHVMLSGIKNLEGRFHRQLDYNSASYKQALQIMLKGNFPRLSAVNLQASETVDRPRSR